MPAIALRAALLFPLVSLAAALPGRPSTPQERATDAKVTRVIRGGRLFDPELAATRPLGQLWIAGDRVVGERSLDTPLPAGAALFEADGLTLLPGLIDLHCHSMVAGGSLTGGLTLAAEENLATHAAFGVLTAVDLHNEPDYVFGLREQVAEAPSMARLLAAGGAFTVPGGHCTQFGFEPNVVRSSADVGTRMDALLARKPDVVKAVVEHGGWGTLGKLPTLDLPTLTAIAERTRAANVPLFCHIWTLDEAKTAARAGVNALVHGVFVGAVDDELIALMKEKDVGYVPTLAVVVGAKRVTTGRSPYLRERIAGLLHPELTDVLTTAGASSWIDGWAGYDEALFFANLRRLHAAGIRCGTGTDAGNPLTPHGPSLLVEIAFYVEAGLTPGQALRCATLESARLLRRDDLGSLAAGKRADFVCVRGDPTQDVAALWQIEGVVKGGQDVGRDQLRERNATRARGPQTVILHTDVAPQVDDFDDGDLACSWGGEWSAVADGLAPGGRSTATLENAESGGSGVLLMHGTLAEGSPYGAFASAMVQWDPQAARVVDVSAAKELVVRVRGHGGPFEVVLDRVAVRDYDVFTASLAVSDEWSERRLPLTAFRQKGFGARVAAGTKDVRGLTISARMPPGAQSGFGEFELEIDSIRFE